MCQREEKVGSGKEVGGGDPQLAWPQLETSIVFGVPNGVDGVQAAVP